MHIKLQGKTWRNVFLSVQGKYDSTLISEVSTIILIYNLQNNLGAILKPKILCATIYQERVTFI